jgi:hypothetical protein
VTPAETGVAFSAGRIISNHFALSPPLLAADRVGVDVHGDVAVAVGVAHPGTRHFESSIKRGLAWSRSTLLHQRSGALAELLKRDIQRTKFLRAQFR